MQTINYPGSAAGRGADKSGAILPTLGRVALAIILGFAGLMLYFVWSVLYSRTLIPMWIPVACSVAVCVAAWFPLRRVWEWISDIRQPIIVALIHLAATGAWGGAGVLWVNYAFAHKDEGRPMEAEVVRRFYRTHDRTRRTGRRSYVKVGEYKTWHIELLMPNGMNREVEVTHRKMQKLDKGDTLTLTALPGALGFTVIRLP